MSDAFSLSFNPLGELVVRLADDSLHTKAVVVRAFPIAEPDHSISILGAEGKELVWIQDLSTVSPANTQAIDRALSSLRDWHDKHYWTGQTSQTSADEPAEQAATA